ncbi:MAG: hypothetical protein LBQ46_08540 [Treponema sp.]|jgi:hypothetical protein|nr:hypothetical protein [Treponema sp.]
MKRFMLLIGACLFGFVSCVSQPEARSEEPVPAAFPVSQAPAVPESPAPPVPDPLPVPEPPPEPPAELPPEPSLAREDPPPEEAPSFDYANITEEVVIHTRAEVQQLVGKLNEIIRSGNYRAWVENLDKSYLDRISSQEFLDNISQQPRLKSQKIVLKSARDYFTNVVVPSRAGDRVDDIDIEFDPAEEKVFAFRIIPNGDRLRLYELKFAEGVWKIAN